MPSASKGRKRFAQSPLERESRLAAGFPKVECQLRTRPLLTDLSLAGIVTSSLFGSKNPYRKESTPEDNHVWVLDTTAVQLFSPAAEALEQWQAEFVACHFVKGRKDVTDIVSRVVDTIGIDGEASSSAEVRARIEKRLGPFLWQIAPAHTVEILIPWADGQPPLKRILGPSNSSGISSHTLPIVQSDASGAPGSPGEGQLVHVTSPLFRNINMNIRLAEAEGWAVISDIDDTIKITGTTDPKWVLRSTLAEIARPTDGMPAFYQMLNRQLRAPAWFYLSASPYNLYPFLHEFVCSTYPPGSILLRDASWMSFSGLLQSLTVGVQKYKVERGSKIHGWLPKRRFICIGDSTQADPESYAELYHNYPGWVKAIYIRTPPDLPHMRHKNSRERFAKAFHGIPDSVWKTFVVPSELIDHVRSVLD